MGVQTNMKLSLTRMDAKDFVISAVLQPSSQILFPSILFLVEFFLEKCIQND